MKRIVCDTAILSLGITFGAPGGKGGIRTDVLN